MSFLIFLAHDPPKRVVDVFMMFEFPVDCRAVIDQDDPQDFQNEIRTKLLELNRSWRDICLETTCTNLDFTETVCSADMNTRVIVKLSLSFVR